MMTPEQQEGAMQGLQFMELPLLREELRMLALNTKVTSFMHEESYASKRGKLMYAYQCNFFWKPEDTDRMYVVRWEQEFKDPCDAETLTMALKAWAQTVWATIDRLHKIYASS